MQRRVICRQPPDSPVGRDVVSATRRALKQCVELLEDPEQPRDNHAEFFQRLGRPEFRNGRGTGPRLIVPAPDETRLSPHCAWRR